MIPLSITPEIVEEINQNIAKMFWPKFNEFKECIYTYLIEIPLEDKIKHFIFLIIAVIVFNKIRKFLHDLNEKYNLYH